MPVKMLEAFYISTTSRLNTIPNKYPDIHIKLTVLNTGSPELFSTLINVCTYTSYHKDKSLNKYK